MKLAIVTVEKKGTSNVLSVTFNDVHEFGVFAYILTMRNQHDGVFYISIYKRALISETIGVSEAKVTKCIKALTDKGLLVRVAKGKYMVNPEWVEYGATKPV